MTDKIIIIGICLIAGAMVLKFIRGVVKLAVIVALVAFAAHYLGVF